MQVREALATSAELPRSDGSVSFKRPASREVELGQASLVFALASVLPAGQSACKPLPFNEMGT
jgi:hypothetical protein